MANQKRNFAKGVMNKDVDERLLPDGMYLDALNVDVINAEGSDAGTVRNIKGNTEVGDLGNAAGSPAVNATTIGAVTSDKDNRIYWLVTSDNYDGIYEYDEDTGVTVRVLQSTTGQLNFDADYYVTGINVIDGFLYWTDNLNEPRRVNISFVKGFDIDDARIDEYIKVIVPAPLRAPCILMQEEDNQETNMEDKFLQFAYRYKYRDNQYSALSPFSAVAFVPGSYSFDYAAGNNESMLNTKNKVEVTFETGNRFVEEVQVVVRDTKSLNVSVVETFNKNKFDPIIPSYSTHKFTFKNNKTYTVLPPDQVTRLYDNVPIKAKAQEIIDRRLIYGNYTQFYDIANCDGSALQVDYEVGYLAEDTTSGTPIQTFRSDRDYEIAIQYGDDEGRFTTALTPADNENTVYIPPSASVTGNSLQVSINSKAPCFATNYRLMIKESKKSYYNIFPILYYADGFYRYFLINQSDKDKFKVGDYIIFKADANGATLSNKDYKILEFEAKPENFLDNDELGGLYFKIKAGSGEFSPGDVVTYPSTGVGANRTGGLFTDPLCNQNTKSAVIDTTEVSYAEDPIFYGEGLNDMSVASSNTYNPLDDLRVTIEIGNPVGGTDTFRCKMNGTEPISAANQGWFMEDVLITGGSQAITVTDPTGTITAFNIQFGTSNGHTVGDSWVVNCRGVISSNGRGVFGRSLLSLQRNEAFIPQNEPFGGVAISNFAGNNEFAINVGAVIRVSIDELFGTQSQSEMVFPPSSRNYENIEEWFYEEQIYNQFVHLDSYQVDRGAYGVFFRRGGDWALGSAGGNNSNLVNDVNGGSSISGAMAYPVRMFISGYGRTEPQSLIPCDQNIITVNWSVTQLDNILLCETRPLEVDDQIFHEIPRTFTITNQEHDVLWRYTDYTSVGSGAVWQGTDYATTYAGKTNIGTLIPGTTPTTASDIPHCFQVGDTIWVYSDSASDGPQGGNNGVAYDVLAVPDNYNIIIDLAFPGAGPVTGGGVSWSDIEQDQSTPTTPAIIKINNPENPNSTYNAYSFGNGLESDRIRDDFNETELQYSPRATLVIDDYEQEVKEASLCYSGIYKGESSINRLNEFNLSKSNFKPLDREFGSIQKLFARDTNLLVFQEDKVSQILYGKNLLSDSAGGGSISSVPEVLGTQIAYAGEYGISFNPESFANWGNDVFWTDERRGSVLMMTSGQTVDISAKGMKDYFRDLFRDNPKTKKLGVYDPYRNQYIIASNEDTSQPCSLELSLSGLGYPSNLPGLEEVNEGNPDFEVISNTSWTVSIVYSAGSNWVTGYPASGFGDQAIYLGISDNRTNVLRTATLTFTYCNGQTATFVVTQARGRKITVFPILVHNGRFTKF